MLKHLKAIFTCKTEFKANLFKSEFDISDCTQYLKEESLPHACEIPVDKAFAPESPPTARAEQRKSLNTETSLTYLNIITPVSDGFDAY